MSSFPPESIDGNDDFVLLHSDTNDEIAQYSKYQNKHTAEIVIRKRIHPNEALKTKKHEEIANRIIDLQPREFSPIAPNYQMKYSLPILRAESQPTDIYIIDSEVTLESVIQELSLKGSRLTDQDLFALVGFLLATGLQMEEHLGFHTEITPGSILILPQNRLALVHPLKYNACVDSLLQDIVDVIASNSDVWKDVWFTDQEKRELYMEIENSEEFELQGAKSSKFMTSIVNSHRILMIKTIDQMFQSVLAAAAMIDIDMLTNSQGELIDLQVTKAIQQAGRFHDPELVDLLRHILQKQAYESFKTLDEDISKQPSVKHKIVTSLNCNPVTAKGIPASGYSSSVLVNVAQELHRVKRQEVRSKSRIKMASVHESIILNSMNNSHIQESGINMSSQNDINKGIDPKTDQITVGNNYVLKNEEFTDDKNSKPVRIPSDLTQSTQRPSTHIHPPLQSLNPSTIQHSHQSSNTHPGMYDHPALNPQPYPGIHIYGSQIPITGQPKQPGQKPVWTPPIPLDSPQKLNDVNSDIKVSKSKNPFDDEEMNESSAQVVQKKYVEDSRKKVEFKLDEKKDKENTNFDSESVKIQLTAEIKQKDQALEDMRNYTKKLEEQLRSQSATIIVIQETLRKQADQNNIQKNEIEHLKQIMQDQYKPQENTAVLDNSYSVSVSQRSQGSYREPPTYNPNKVPPSRISGIISSPNSRPELSRMSSRSQRRKQPQSTPHQDNQTIPMRESLNQPITLRQPPSHTVIDGRKKPVLSSHGHSSSAADVRHHRPDTKQGIPYASPLQAFKSNHAEDLRSSRQIDTENIKQNIPYMYDQAGNKVYLDDTSSAYFAKLRNVRPAYYGPVTLNNIHISSQLPINYESREYVTPIRPITSQTVPRLTPTHPGSLAIGQVSLGQHSPVKLGQMQTHGIFNRNNTQNSIPMASSPSFSQLHRPSRPQNPALTQSARILPQILDTNSTLQLNNLGSRPSSSHTKRQQTQ